MVVGIGRKTVLLKTVAAVGPGGVCLAIVEDNLFVSVFPLVEIGIEVDIPFPESKSWQRCPVRRFGNSK